MEAKFESLSLFEFQKLFPDDLSCCKYLSDIKIVFKSTNDFLKITPSEIVEMIYQKKL